MMTLRTHHTPLIAALLLGAGAAQADVSPADVWAEWQAQMETYGYGIEAEETTTGSDLEVSNIQMTVDVPEEDGTILVTLPKVTFRDNGDGTVAVVMPATMAMNVTGEMEEGSFDATVDYNNVGLAVVVSGSPEEMTYTYSAASMGMALAELQVDGEPVDLGTVSMELTNVSGTQTDSGNMLRTSNQKFSADQLMYTVDITDPEGSGDYVKLKGNVKDVAFTGQSATPKDMDPEDMAKSLAQGFAFDGGVSHRGGETDFDMLAEGDAMKGASRSGAGVINIAMDADAMRMEMRAEDMNANMQVPDLPFPVEYAMGEIGFEFLMPLAQTDAEQDFKLAMTVGDFTMADMLWGLFDPSGQLPRDPATVAFDLTGKVKLLSNIFDPEAMESEEVPGEIHQASIEELKIKAVGAELTGEGDFTFDNTDLTSFDGMPRPEGALNLALTGGNGLLDKLVAMGFVPEEDAMGVRMMIGMFSVPGDGEDNLKSKIEVNSEGHVLANGQRLK